jgi:hypothetical protein
VQDKEIYRLYSMAKRLFDLLERLQEDVLANAVGQPIDLDPAPPQNEPVSPVNDPIENEELQAANLDLDVILLFIFVFVCIVVCLLRV